jgi:hypothetical protein
MSTADLERRVSQLEQQYSQLLARLKNGQSPPSPGRDDWKQSVGMFRGDAIFQEMSEDVARRREAERDEARRGASDETP